MVSGFFYKNPTLKKVEHKVLPTFFSLYTNFFRLSHASENPVAGSESDSIAIFVVDKALAQR